MPNSHFHIAADGWGLIMTLAILIAGIGPARAEWLGGGPLPPANTEIKSIAVNSNGLVIVGTKSGGTFMSDREISKWEIQSFGFPAGEGQDIKSLVVLDNDEILAGTKFGVFRSKDHGETFERSSSGLEENSDSLDARFLFIDPVHPHVVHLATKGGYYYSENRGQTWTQNNRGFVTQDEHDTKTIAVRSSPYTVFIGSKHGLFKTADPKDGSWELTAPNRIDHTEVKALTANQDGSSLYLYAKSQGEKSLATGVYRSDDGGETFHPIPLPSEEEVKEYGFSPSPVDPDEILASDKRGAIFRSRDRGENWETIPIPELNDEIKALVRDRNDPDRVWYIGSKSGFYKTQNSGLTFKPVNEGLVSAAAEGKHIVVDPDIPTHVYVATKTGLWFSTSGGETAGEEWVELTGEISTLFNLDIRRMLIDFANDPSGGTIYIAAKFDLFKYTMIDGSRLWIDSSEGIAPAPYGRDKDIKWICQDPDNPTVFYASRRVETDAGPLGEVFRSVDAGARWEKISDDRQFSGELHGDPKNITIVGDFLFIGTKGGVVRGDKREALPISFEPVLEGLIFNEKQEVDIRQTAVSPDGDLYVASKTGVYYLPNNSNTWIDITGNLPGEKAEQRPDTEGIYLDPFGRLWVGSKKVGLFYTLNPASGKWSSAADPLPAGKAREIISITSAPSEPTRFYVGTKEGTFTNIISIDTPIIDWRMFE